MIEKEIEEFETFVNHYDLSVPAIERKYKHSLRVMKFAIDIAKSLNLTEDEIILAAKAGLLHDIGRFEQWTQYCTYNDLKSIDHADLGVEILKKNNYIEYLCGHYEAGRYAWVLEDIEKITPIKAKGKLSIWNY